MIKRLIIGALFCTGVVGVNGQVTGKYAELDIRNNDDFSGYEMLDSAVMNARVIMTGENHLYVKFNSKMELKMLRYLNQKIGLRNFVIELGAARAHFLNRYISDSKDTAAANYLKATTSPRYMDLFNRLRKFNSSLSDSQKIHVYGIDVERFNDLPLMRLSELLPLENVPDEIRVGVETVKSAADYMLKKGLEEYEKARDETSSGGYEYEYDYEQVPFYITPTIIEFVRYYDSLKPAFSSWLGGRFAEIDQVVGWLKEYKQWNDYENTTFQYIWREENIYKNLSSLVKENPGEKFYGQFGRCHVAYEEQNGECGWYGYHSVINKMRTRYFHNYDSVLTIGLFYGGNSNYSRYYSDREDNKDIQEEIDALMDKAEAKMVTLFHLHDEEASMPLLSRKFTFAVVNKSVDVEDVDSVQSEIITWDDKPGNSFRPHQFFGYGYTLSTVDLGVLGEHVASNGYSTEIGAFATHDLFYGYAASRFEHSLKYSFLLPLDLHETDSAQIQYVANQLQYRLAYQLLKRKRVLGNLGVSLGYGREKVSVTTLGTSFLDTRKDREFVNPAVFVGASAQLRLNVAKYFFVGLQAAGLYDLSSDQWQYRASTQDYGSPGTVSNGFTGYYFSASLGFLINTPEYSSDYSSE